MRVRDATREDVPGIVAILNDAIEHRTAVWSESLATVEGRLRRLAERRAAGNPVLVADDGAGVAGFASFGAFRPWSEYHPSVELSIYVGRDRRDHGIGRLLLAELVDHAVRLGKHVMIAGIEGSNEASLRLHAGVCPTRSRSARRGSRRQPGAGVNVEAKLLILAHAFEVWRTHRVMLCTDARNERSRRAIEALGARFEGVRRAERPAADGSLRDTAAFGITAGDWPRVRAALERRLLRPGPASDPALG